MFPVKVPIVGVPGAVGGGEPPPPPPPPPPPLSMGAGDETGPSVMTPGATLKSGERAGEGEGIGSVGLVGAGEGEGSDGGGNVFSGNVD